MVSPTSFFNRMLCRSAISVDTLEPWNIEDSPEIGELKKLIAVLEKSVRDLKVNFEDSNVLINKLAEKHGNFENVGLLKKFHEREILEILSESIKETNIRRGVAKVIRRIYLDSFANDPKILYLAKYLKENIRTFRHMLKNLQKREVDLIKKEIQKIKCLEKNKQKKQLSKLLERDVFKFFHVQSILDETTLRRLDDYLEYERSQFQDDKISRYSFNLIKSHTSLIEEIVKLQNLIGKEILSLNNQ